MTHETRMIGVMMNLEITSIIRLILYIKIDEGSTKLRMNEIRHI